VTLEDELWETQRYRRDTPCPLPTPMPMSMSTTARKRCRRWVNPLTPKFPTSSLRSYWPMSGWTGVGAATYSNRSGTCTSERFPEAEVPPEAVCGCRWEWGGGWEVSREPACGNAAPHPVDGWYFSSSLDRLHDQLLSGQVGYCMY